MSDLLDLSARSVIEAFKTRQLSPVDYMRALIARVEACEPQVNALWLFRPEEALTAARQAETRYMQGAPQGPLDGMPVSVKELIATKGDPVPLGTRATPDLPEPEDAPCAARLREAGAIIFAKNTCPDFGMTSSGVSSFHGLTKNPWNLTKNCGGSSSGAGVAAAVGYGPLHVGTDIGGSIRIPAGWVGLFGFKPSNGRVPINPYYTGRVAGPMTRHVDDAAMMMTTISKPDWRDATSLPYEALDWNIPAADVKGLKLGLMLDAGCGHPTDAPVREAVERAARAFEAAGAEIVPTPPVLTREMLDGLDYAWRARFWGLIQTFPPERQELVLPYIYAWAQQAENASAVQVAEGFDQTFAMRRATASVFQKVDAILSPVNPNADYPVDWNSPTNDPLRPFEHICFTVPWNMGEQPACSIHCGFTPSGVPIGLQIIAPRFHDLRVFALARAFESWNKPITNWPRPGAK